MTGELSRLLPVAAALAVVAAASCARQGAPPGGPEDRRAPVVIGTRPGTEDAGEVVEDPVRIVFNERISERPSQGRLDDAVVVSPRTGDVRVEHGRNALEVDLSGGFRPGLVYRITVRPVIVDMFGNAMAEPFEFLFSTGGEVTSNAVAGVVLDRVTGDPVEGYEVRLDPAGEEGAFPHVAVTDTGGFFAFRSVPTGRFDLVAYQDRNRDREVGEREPQGRRRVLVGETDTLVLEVPVLEWDTSAAVLARVEVVDSATLRLVFDDHLDPAAGPERVGVSLAAGDSGSAPSAERVLHPWEYEAWRDSLAAEGDSLAPRPGGLEDARRIPGPGEVPAPPGQERGGVSGDTLPAQELVVVLSDSLRFVVPYEVTVTGVVNVNQLGRGGGTGTVVRERPEVPPDTAGAAGDTVEAPPDTSAALPATTDGLPDTTDAPPDTTVVAPDTSGAPPDTTGIPADAEPDTAAVPPDTSAAPPDTGAAPPTAERPPDIASAPHVVPPPPDPAGTAARRAFADFPASAPRGRDPRPGP